MPVAAPFLRLAKDWPKTSDQDLHGGVAPDFRAGRPRTRRKLLRHHQDRGRDNPKFKLMYPYADFSLHTDGLFEDNPVDWLMMMKLREHQVSGGHSRWLHMDDWEAYDFSTMIPATKSSVTACWKKTGVMTCSASSARWNQAIRPSCTGEMASVIRARGASSPLTPDIRKQSYPGSKTKQVAGKPGGGHIWITLHRSIVGGRHGPAGGCQRRHPPTQASSCQFQPDRRMV